ncbi:MAG: hypothetical protein IKY62_03400 [Clostridia bacterium]|nr:hypothetical protein [Clostridia bacterium]
MKIEKVVICHSIYFDCYSHSFCNEVRALKRRKRLGTHTEGSHFKNNEFQIMEINYD